MKTLGKYKLCETIQDLNICRFIEIQVYLRKEKMPFALLIYEDGESFDNTDPTLLEEKMKRVKKEKYFGLYPVPVVEKFVKDAQKVIGKLFPTDFTDNEFIRLTIIDLLIAKCEYYQTGRYFDMSLHTKIKELEELLAQEGKEKGTILELYQSFEAICFSMSQADGIMTVNEIKQLSVYGFYTHKHLLMQKIKDNGRRSNYTD